MANYLPHTLDPLKNDKSRNLCSCGKIKHRYAFLCRSCRDAKKRKQHNVINKGFYILVEVISKGKKYFVKLDVKDKSILSKYRLFLDKDGYVLAYDRENKKMLRLTKVLLGEKEDFVIDHKNCNKLDNRRSNLRFCTRSQNSMNRRCRGYYWSKIHKKWIAQITLGGKGKHLGVFKSEEDAKKARVNAVKKYFGEYANLTL